VERHDPTANTWVAVAPLRVARFDSNVAVLEGKLYAVGGNTYDLSSVERYDPATNAWGAVAPLGTPRTSHTTAVLDGKLYAVGGYATP